MSLIQYQKLLFSENDYLKLYHKHKKMFNSQQVSGGREGGSEGVIVALDPGFLFWILSPSFDLQSCKTKFGTESLGFEARDIDSQ